MSLLGTFLQVETQFFFISVSEINQARMEVSIEVYGPASASGSLRVFREPRLCVPSDRPRPSAFRRRRAPACWNKGVFAQGLQYAEMDELDEAGAAAEEPARWEADSASRSCRVCGTGFGTGLRHSRRAY